MHVHLDEGAHQRFLAPAVALEKLRGEPAVSVLRHADLELAHAGDQRPLVIARAVPATRSCPLALRGAHRVGHLGLEHLLHHTPDQLLQGFLVLLHDRA